MSNDFYLQFDTVLNTSLKAENYYLRLTYHVEEMEPDYAKYKS